MTIETAEEYLPSDDGVSHAFDLINARYAQYLGNAIFFQQQLATQNIGVFIDYIHAGLGWLANRALSPFLRQTGTQAWRLLEPGPHPVVTVLNNDLLSTTAQITRLPVIRPPHFVPEGIISTRSLHDDRTYFIIPIQFFLHAQAHPVEAVAHLAGGATQMRDIERISWQDIQTQQKAIAVMREMNMRAVSASTQVLFEAGDSYRPSSQVYDRVHRMGKRMFPNGTRDLPIEMQF